MCKFFRTSVLNFAGLFKALESSDIFAQNVEFDIHYRSHFDVAEVGILSGIRNNSNGKCVVCRITDGERNTVNGNAALVDREIAFSSHFLIELIFESKISRAISVFHCEVEGTTVAEVSLELLTKGRKLANQQGVELHAIVAGTGIKGQVEDQILPYGVDKLFVFDAEGLFPYTSAPHTDILVNLFKEEKPQIALMGATVIGRDLGPRVSSSLTSGLTADCTELEIGDYDDKKSGKHYEGLLYQIRPAFGGNIVATIVNPDHRPQMATVRSGVMQKSIYEGECKKEVVYPEVSKYVPAEDFVVKVLDHHVEAAKHNLKGSAIVVAGGYGVGSKEGFDQLFELAHLLHGEVGASRAAVDAGWVDHDRQIGQTGVTVHPKVYIACGISGQIQHIAGMQDSGIIISVNNDPDAPINKIADYVINGNVEDVVPKLIKYYKQNSK
jgi:electron transfer flavoprotein alpha subunit